MATTVSKVVDATLAAVDSDAGPQLVATWCSERYRELCNKARFRHLLKQGELVLPAVIDDGTATITQGSEIVVGTAAARTAWASSVERYFRLDSRRNWHRIASLTAAGDLVLESPITEASASATAYKIVARFHSLAGDLRHIGQFTHPRLFEPMPEVDHQELDQAVAGRLLVADLPEIWAEAGVDADGFKRVEIYPYVKMDQLVRYSYYCVAPALTLNSTLPAEIDLHVLKTGALIDVHRYEMVMALRKNQVDAAGVWRNEMNTLTTRWEEKIREAVKADRAGDVMSLQMHTRGFPHSTGRLIRNAMDYVWAKGNRP